MTVLSTDSIFLCYTLGGSSQGLRLVKFYKKTDTDLYYKKSDVVGPTPPNRVKFTEVIGDNVYVAINMNTLSQNSGSYTQQI